jgi:V/A-type H+-transporting ATPase subunit C
VARLDFANGRLGARRARLAGPAALRALLAPPTLDLRLALLRTLPLGAALPEDLGPEPLSALERVLWAALHEEGCAVLADAEGARTRALLAAFLSLEEAEAVKVILRGVARGAAAERALAAAPPVPGLRPAALRLAASAPSLAAAVGALAAAGSGLAPALREALGGDGTRALLALEIAADRAALLRARAACRRRGEDGAVLARHLAERADARNAATLLLLAGAAPAPAPWVPGGRRWREDALSTLARAGRDAARGEVARAFPGAAGAAQPWQADRALERALVASLRREARRRPLSIAVPLAYLAARREEVRRVTLLLRATALELPGDEVLDLVEA